MHKLQSPHTNNFRGHRLIAYHGDAPRHSALTLLKSAFFLMTLLLYTSAFAQSGSSWGTGRFSLFAQGANQQNPDGTSVNFSELVSYFSLYSPYDRQTGTEYGIDLRAAGYPGMEGRSTRFSLYNAYVGHRTDSYGIRGGQMWINELGALGSVGGGMGYFKHGHLRFGGFGGFEPEILNAGYVPNVLKSGGFVTYEGEHGLNSSVGYVNVRNTGVTERSVLVFTNYIPSGPNFSLYQSAELDLSGPGGQGSGGLNYFFINARGNPTQALELQGTYHHGRSIDARTITLDAINGRPVSPEALNGFLYDSAEGRVTVTVFSNFRIFGAYGRDKNGENAAATDRIQYGFYTSSIGNSGIDLHFSGYRYSPPNSPSYGSWSVSAGRMMGSKLYLSGEYSSSLAVLMQTGSDGVVVVNKPHAARYTIYSLYNISRALSLQFNVDKITGDLDNELRFLAGFTFRFY